MKPEAKKLMLHLLANSVILIALYYVIPALFHFSFMPHIYIIAGAVLALYYVIYNRGFVGRNATPDMLPNSMSPIEKQRFLEDSRERMKKSRWALTVIIPIIFTFLADMIYLFIFPYFEGIFA